MRKRDDVFAGLLLIFFGGAVIFGAVQLRVGTITDSQAGFFPFLGGALLIVFSCVLLLQALRGQSLGGEPFGKISSPAILIAAMAVYTAIFDRVGYVIATLMLSMVVLRVLKAKSLLATAAISLGLSVGSYLLFDRLLGVSLPGGWLKTFP